MPRIAYFPFLFMKKHEEIRSGPATVWRFSSQHHKRISDQGIQQEMEIFFREYTHRGKSIDGIGVVSLPGRECYELTDSDIPVLREARLILFLGYVSKSNTVTGDNAGHKIVTSENFTLVHQIFEVGNAFRRYQGGGIACVDSTTTRDHPTYEKPPYVLASTFSEPDLDLINALSRLKKCDRSLYRKILRATDAFMGGYYNSPDSSHEQRVLQQVRAFEILFQTENRAGLRDKVKQYCTPDTERQFQYKYQGVKKKKERKGPAAEIWADRFYSLRSDIIHGNKIRPSQFLYKRQRHIDLGLWFFLVAVKSLLNEALVKDLFWDTIVWRGGNFEYDRMWKLHLDVYATLIPKKTSTGSTHGYTTSCSE